LRICLHHVNRVVLAACVRPNIHELAVREIVEVPLVDAETLLSQQPAYLPQHTCSVYTDLPVAVRLARETKLLVVPDEVNVGIIATLRHDAVGREHSCPLGQVHLAVRSPKPRDGKNLSVGKLHSPIFSGARLARFARQKQLSCFERANVAAVPKQIVTDCWKPSSC